MFSTQARITLLIIYLSAMMPHAELSTAEVIKLKDGSILTGKIISKSDDYIVIRSDDGSITYPIATNRIRNISESSAPVNQAAPKAEAAASVSQPEIKKESESHLEKLKSFRKKRYEEEVLEAKKARGRVRIKFSNNRYGVVDAIINGKVKATLLVDTGCSVVLVSNNIARQLGIENTNDLENTYAVIADGSVVKQKAIVFSSVKVGYSELKDVKGAISTDAPMPGIDGLLGMSYLGNFHVKMNKDDDSITLEKY